MRKKIKEENKPEVNLYFSHYTCREDYENAYVKDIEPMTAKELEDEKQDDCLNSDKYFIEEKFDGTRGTLHFYSCDLRNLKSYKVLTKERKYLYCELLNGTGFSGGKKRVYEFYIKNKDNKDTKLWVEFCKKEWGIGGHSDFVSVPDEDIKLGADCDSKGLNIHSGHHENYVFECDYTWAQVATALIFLIESGVYYVRDSYARVFSRRISKQTDWYCENTDSVPHLRDLCIPELKGTIIDGEMFIPNRPFKDVSSTLNCLPDKAIQRQQELGNVVFHAFDIIYYKGILVRKLPLYKRKKLLEKVVNTINSPYVEMVAYQKCGQKISLLPYYKTHKNPYKLDIPKETYPTLYRELKEHKDKSGDNFSPKALYEYIVATGGEGVIIKDINGQYNYKRGREYQKIKKFLTKELILIGFTEPTREYTGKFPNDFWEYWENEKGKLVPVGNVWKQKLTATIMINNGYTPVTRHYYFRQVGQMVLGVIIKQHEYDSIPKSKQGTLHNINLNGYTYTVMEVCECSGFDDDTREFFTSNISSIIHTVVEVGCNEVFKDSGKLRHPRFLRMREDKEPERVIWKDHIDS